MYHGWRDTGRGDKPLNLVAVRWEWADDTEIVCAACINWEDDYYDDWLLFEAPKPAEKCARCGKRITNRRKENS
jgi:hypothetical protein